MIYLFYMQAQIQEGERGIGPSPPRIVILIFQVSMLLKNLKIGQFSFTMWAPYDVNLVSPQQKQRMNFGWATGYLKP